MIGVIAYVLLVALCVAGYLAYLLRHINTVRLEREANAAYWSAKKRLKAWQIARPYLRVGQCAYSQSLVREMIDAYEQLLALGAERDREHLEYLYGLLTNGPPPYAPQTFDSASAGSFLLARSAW